MSNRAWGWRRRNKRLHAVLLRGGMSARQARALFMASRPMNRRRVREWIASGRPIF